jgi:hypothetical protein
MKDNFMRSFDARSTGGRAAKVERTTSAFEKERNRIRLANDEKTTRLRGLRLAKEAADRNAAASIVAAGGLLPSAPKSRGRKRPQPTNDKI